MLALESSGGNMRVDVIENLMKENQELKAMVAKASTKIEELEEERITAFVIGDAVMDGIIVVDAEGFVSSVNKAYTTITNIAPEEVVGKHMTDLLNQNLFQGSVSLEVIRTKEKKSSMCIITRNNKQVLLTGTPIFNQENELIKVITVMRNLTDLINLKEKLEKAEEKKNLAQSKLISMRMQTESNGFLGTSPSIMRIKELIEYVAPTDANVLIMGPTGSGKEVISRYIYQFSRRDEKPYIKINCAAIPEHLLESELFGYVKGAFTGADLKDKKGLFETAKGGTILLDEISELPIKLQPKLLRVLQEREITPVGGVTSIKIDTRVIAASNKDLKTMVQDNLFRADLYYRLNVFPIQVPSLYERREDIPDLAAFFLNRFNSKYNKKKVLDNTAIFELMKYEWPGNVRELENVVERMTVISPNRILVSDDVKVILDLGEGVEQTISTVILGNGGLKEAVQNFERHLVEKALKEGGSSYAAARILKTTQPTVIRKAQALGIATHKK
jgi:PAS domain S-box-containing protein